MKDIEVSDWRLGLADREARLVEAINVLAGEVRDLQAEVKRLGEGSGQLEEADL